MTNKNNEEILDSAAISALAEGMSATPLSNDVKSRIMGKIKQRISTHCPEGGKTIYKGEGEWFAISDKISIKILHQDFESKIQSALWRLKPGAVIPGHRHHHDEECLVMEGDIRIGQHKLSSGDFHLMHGGSYHPDLVSDHGALLYLRHDMHENLTGTIHQ